MGQGWKKYREKIIGLGENSSHKSYYPELQDKIEELETSKKNLQTILDSTSDSIVIHDVDGKILLLNNQAKLFYNIYDDFSKYTVFDLSSKSQDLDQLYQIWEGVLQSKGRTLEWLARPIGLDYEIPVQVSLNRCNWYGETVIVAVVRDFSERKKYENEMIRARKKAEESDSLKSAFLANLSHEIRTPMNAIVGFSTLLKDEGLTAEKRDNYVDIIQSSSNHLLSIINDIIEISKIDTNQVVPHFKPVKLNALLSEIFQIFSMSSGETGIKLELCKPAMTSELDIITDEVKLRQILINLLTNAFKFTEKGKIEFGYEIRDKLRFYVKDTGIGISEKYHHVVFERFRQIENDISINKGGSGLGLAISKAYVEMLGGKIHLESAENAGSKFWFTIPLKINPASKDISGIPEEALKFEQKKAKILVAEDEDTNFFLLSEILRKHDYEVLRASNGKVALDILSGNQNIDLVLMDIKMPVMDGFKSFNLIKKLYPKLPVIAQTAYTLAEEEDRILTAGFNGYIAKPVNKEKLLKAIAPFLKRNN